MAGAPADWHGAGAAEDTVDDRIVDLITRYELPAFVGGRLRCLVHLLVDDPHAPTAVRDSGRVLDDHVADSLVALELDAVRSATNVADIGSGAGLPGLPLAIALPGCRFRLVESASRKCAFLESAIARCRVANAEVVHARAEAWREGHGQCDVVTARALAALPVVLEYAAPLLRLGGRVVAWRGRRDRADETAAVGAASELGLRAEEIRHVRPYPRAEHRHLHVWLKVTQTPLGFPRRPGVAVKRPLGSR